jgi:eukaryotic-like serine/threonine-protein kinase
MKVCPTCQLRYQDDDVRCFMDGAALAPLADARIGTLLAGRYLLEAPLGEGGMATVYRARNSLVDRPVAVKVMSPSMARDANLKERFRREAKNTAALAHPNIVEILDYGEADDGAPFLVMEILEGQSLDKLIQGGAMPAAQVAALGAHVARGLARAHDFSVIHRDLKPENIFVTRGHSGRGVAKILDFGIARSAHDQRLTSAGQIFGTPQYMAPERVTSIDTGPPADLYALGIILFEMLTGRLPFTANDITGFLVAHLREPPPSPSAIVPNVPRRLEELILRLLAKKPEDRPVDAHTVDKELTALAPAEDVSADLEDTHQSILPRPASKTLPPTTLDRWSTRAALFEEMLKRAYPRGDAPPELVRDLGQVRAALVRTQELRSAALREQRKLESMEQMAREGRTRLGHAMNMLGQDLSAARTAARAAELEVKPYFDAVSNGERGYQEAYRKMLGAGGTVQAKAPSKALVTALRETADALDRWLLAHGTSEQARAWVESKSREVKDLEFQCDAMRAQLERLETGYEDERHVIEGGIAASGREIESLGQSLMEIGTRFVTPLRSRRELSDLLGKLEDGTPAAGIPR